METKNLRVFKKPHEINKNAWAYGDFNTTFSFVVVSKNEGTTHFLCIIKKVYLYFTSSYKEKRERIFSSKFNSKFSSRKPFTTISSTIGL